MAATLSPPPSALKAAEAAIASQIARVPYSVSGLLEHAGRAVDEHGAGGGDAGGVVGRGRVTDVHELVRDREVAHRDLDALAVADAGEVGRQHDLVAVLGEDRLRLLDERLQLAGPDELHGRRADVDAARRQHDVGDQARGEHGVDDAVAQRGRHHRERLLDLGAAEDEDARPGRLLAQTGEVLVLALEEPAHGRRQQLLEADEGGLRAVRGGERVADVEVGERRQLAHHQRLGLVLRREVELALEERELLAAEAHVVEQQDVAVREPADRFARGRPADVVDEPDVARR